MVTGFVLNLLAWTDAVACVGDALLCTGVQAVCFAMMNGHDVQDMRLYLLVLLCAAQDMLCHAFPQA